MWENINIPKNKRFMKLAIGWGLTLLFIGVVTGIFYVVIYVKVQAVESALEQVEENP
jgi:hypothetical protein